MIADRGWVSDSHLAELFVALFDDAAMFPPRDMALNDAVRGHYRHRMAWYSELVGPFVCLAGRLPSLDALAGSLGIGRIEVSAVVPEGIGAAPAIAQAARGWRHVQLRALEVPLAAEGLPAALRTLSVLATEDRAVYLEIEPSAITERVAHKLAPSGIRLKLRTGETLIDAFHTESELARALVLCAAERLAFKCSAGLHQAVRHRDSDTFFQHHGFLNIALAARVAAATGNVNSTRAVLAQRDPRAIAYLIADLTTSDVRAIRAVFSCVSTHNVGEPLRDLIELGLVVGR